MRLQSVLVILTLECLALLADCFLLQSRGRIIFTPTTRNNLWSESAKSAASSVPLQICGSQKSFSLYCDNVDDVTSNPLTAPYEENLPDANTKTLEELPVSQLSNVKAVRYFINLTNGIEAIDVLLKQGVPMEHINYFRLQSTHCEMRNYEGIIENLDYNLLMSLALGYVCVIYDYGSRGNGMEDQREGIPRAYWWGTEWIRYVLDHFWHLEDEGKEVRMVRGYNSRKIFEEQVKLLPKDLKRRIKYFRIYLQSKRIHLYPVYSKTGRDGEREYYSALLFEKAAGESSDLLHIQSMSRTSIDTFVQTKLVSQDMHIYRSTDFEGFGRAQGYGKEKGNEKGWKDKKIEGSTEGSEGGNEEEMDIENEREIDRETEIGSP